MSQTYSNTDSEVLVRNVLLRKLSIIHSAKNFNYPYSYQSVVIKSQVPGKSTDPN
jgi:hypothetical protein